MKDYLQTKALELLMVLDLQYFAEEGEGEQQQGEQQEEQKQSEQKEEKTFTQKDVNNLIKKQTAEATEKLLKSLGFEEFENAKDGINKFKEWQDSQKTEAEKQAEALQNANKTLEEVNAEKATLAAQLAAFKAGANAESLDDVILLAQAKVSDEVTIEDAIAQTLEKYPQFKAQATEQDDKPPAPQFTRGNPTPPGNSQMTREQFAKLNYADRVKFQQEQPTVFKKLFG